MSEEERPADAEFEAVYSDAYKTDLTSMAYRAFASRLPVADDRLDELLAYMVRRGSRQALMPVLLSALDAGRPVDGRHLVRGARLMEEEMLIPSIACRCTGDPASALLKATGNARLPLKIRCTCLLSAAWCLAREGLPAAYGDIATWVSRLRLEASTEETEQILAAACALVADAGIQTPWPELEASSMNRIRRKGREHLENVKKYTELPVLAPLEEAEWRAPHPVVQRPRKEDGAKVGRNDPCPCGSGLKYKKCCLRYC